ncbi:MAG TPA: BREX-3 system phosphatase PglZ [Verrucomicrobiae bacterium]|nr:BREX-3 system phosphatase PglZ [Verrucomicrobiae bacterium]
MSSWRDQILREFTPKVARLTIVADPDGLLLEEGILEGIRERGFDLIPFDDHIAFRYAYESKFRSRWDRGEQTDLVVVLRSAASDLSSLPFDLLQAGRRLSFSLGEIFPNLSYPVVAALDRSDLDALYEAQTSHAPGQLGDNATKEFALRHVFEVAPELIKQPSDLLRVLLRRHYCGQRIPAILDERFIHLLRQRHVFDDWPLSTLLPDREAFFAFLQERWPIFLDREASNGTPNVRDGSGPYGLATQGPLDLPFDHHDIRVYIDNLFTEGLLRPVAHAHAISLAKTWAAIGVQTDEKEDRSRRFRKLVETLPSALPTDDAKYSEWCAFARGWAELLLLANAQPDDGEVNRFVDGLRIQVNNVFTAWLLKRYAGLVNLPPTPPVMLHHIPRFLACQMTEDSHAKIAILVLDGLSLDQWLVIRETLALRQPSLVFREQTVFAWVPSLTSVSRQAAFAGRPPLFFPNSIHTTEREPVLWTQFWIDQRFTPDEVIYLKGLGDGSLEGVSETLSHPKAKVAGLVVDKIDRIMHGMELGAAGMHNQVRQWAAQPYLSSLLDLLLQTGFQVYLTSDHGNVEAEGCGRPAEGAVADFRGERARIYPNAALRAQVKANFPTAMEWDPIGLPDDYLALLAPSGQAFIQEHQRTVSHGGISIEELIVPLVRIERRDA